MRYRLESRNIRGSHLKDNSTVPKDFRLGILQVTKKGNITDRDWIT